MDESRRCRAKSKRSGERCRKAALKGKDVCRNHGGATPIKHGLRSKYTEALLGEQIADLRKDPDLASLDHQIAIARALQEKAIGRLDSTVAAPDENLELPWLDAIRQLVSTAGVLIERKLRRMGPNSIPDERARNAIAELERALAEEGVEEGRHRRIVDRVAAHLRCTDSLDEAASREKMEERVRRALDKLGNDR